MPTLTQLQEAFARQSLFDDKTWRLSPEPWPLSAQQLTELERIGQACLEFMRALETLYIRSLEGRNLLRNQKLTAPWVAEYLDRGKPYGLLEHARDARQRGTLPAFLRPDLLVTDDGFALTEIDAVPGGIGLTAFLNHLYADSAVPGTIVGAGDRMVQAFYEALAARAPQRSSPVIAILVSDEAATYRPEMQWIADVLQRQGRRVYCMHPDDVIPLSGSLCFDLDGSPERIDVIYRFWEMFDLANVGRVGEYLLAADRQDEVAVVPPMRPFQEEKMTLALYHHHLLTDFWKENLSKAAQRTLARAIPRSWIVEDLELPPTAVLDAPMVNGRPIHRWEQLGLAGQKERQLILKISGFHETGWGARSVVFGGDVSREDWTAAIRNALDSSATHPFVLQEYRKPSRLSHPVYRGPGDPRGAADEIIPMEGRVRLCPYYAIHGDTVELTGVLATFCPADKKIIHGMKDAALLPARKAE